MNASTPKASPGLGANHMNRIPLQTTTSADVPVRPVSRGLADMSVERELDSLQLMGAENPRNWRPQKKCRLKSGSRNERRLADHTLRDRNIDRHINDGDHCLLLEYLHGSYPRHCQRLWRLPRGFHARREHLPTWFRQRPSDIRPSL
jgi:hypothetical protein